MKRCTIGGGRLLGLLVAFLLLVLAGCAPQTGPGPENPNQVWIDSAANVGDTICGFVVLSEDPDQIGQATLAAAAAKSLLDSPSPSLTALQAALAEGMPKKQAGQLALVIRAIRKQLGTNDILVKGSLAYDMALALVEGCQAMLGETAMLLDLQRSIAELRAPEVAVNLARANVVQTIWRPQHGDS